MTVSNAVIYDVSPHMTVMLIAGLKQSWTDTVTVSKAVMFIVGSTINPVLLAAATNTVVCSRNVDENAKVGVRL